MAGLVVVSWTEGYRIKLENIFRSNVNKWILFNKMLIDNVALF